MKKGVEPIASDATVGEAALRMAELDRGAVVVGAADALVGILTDRDIILRLVAVGRNPAEVRVGEVMSSTLFTCRDDDTLEYAFREMRERQVRRLPVIDSAGKPVGIVTLRDLARIGREPESVEQALRDLVEPHGDPARPADPPAAPPATAGGTSGTAG
jgi:CBS domain-containing protein